MMNSAVPTFEPDEVGLLVSAVEKALEQLRAANERVGGNDSELIEYGRRYAIVLQKLNAVVNIERAGQSTMSFTLKQA